MEGGDLMKRLIFVGLFLCCGNVFGYIQPPMYHGQDNWEYMREMDQYKHDKDMERKLNEINDRLRRMEH